MLALGLLFVLATNIKIDVKKFIDFGFQTVLIIANFYGYLQYFDLDPLPWSNPSKAVALTLGNPNFAGALFGMLTVVAFVKVIYTNVNKVRVSYLFLFFSTIFLGFQTYALQSQLLLIVSILIFLFINIISSLCLVSFLIRSIYDLHKTQEYKLRSS
jgi:hypothetical protein